MFWQQIVNGTTVGASYALVAVGFTMVFGVLRLTNLANGSIFLLGGYLVLMYYQMAHLNFIIALILGVLSTATVGFLLERTAIRRLRKTNAPRLSGMITTLAISTILDNAIILIFGSETRPFPRPADFGRVQFGNVVINRIQIYMLLAVLAIIIVISLLVYRTKLGNSMRAISQNLEAAKLMGINVNRVIMFTFMISAALACFAGTMIGLYNQSIDVSLSASVGNKTFAAAVLAGVGVIPGAIVSGLIIGISESLVSAYISAGYKDAISFAILILVLLFKPAGLFGKKEINKV